MVIKVYVSGICGSQDVRKQQQRVLFILSMLQLDVETIDVTEPGRDDDKNFMQEELKKHNKKNLLPPQIFNDAAYCGDYDDFQLAADDDILMTFLKLEDASPKLSNGTGKPVSSLDTSEQPTITQNGMNSNKREFETEPEEENKEEQLIDFGGEENAIVNEDDVNESLSSLEQPQQVEENKVKEMEVESKEKSEEESEEEEEESD